MKRIVKFKCQRPRTEDNRKKQPDSGCKCISLVGITTTALEKEIVVVSAAKIAIGLVSLNMGENGTEVVSNMSIGIYGTSVK